jgi:hypothetical protein
MLVKHKIDSIFLKNQKKEKNIYTRSYDLQDRIEEIKQRNFKNILLISNKSNFEEVSLLLKDRKVTWCSSHYEDICIDAEPIDNIDFNNFDVILINSINSKDDYRYILKAISEFRKIPSILWVDKEFEFCGGTIPISKKCEDVEVLIFNHFGVYFGLYDPLLVNFEIFNSDETIQFQKILNPNESICLKLSDYLTKIDDSSCIFHSCEHPRLTFKRHNRWRSVATYYWKNSRAMAHSNHDFLESGRHNEFKISLDLINEGEFKITLPNYSKDAKKNSENYKVLAKEVIKPKMRLLNKRIEEVNFIKTNNPKNSKAFFGVDYMGYGGSFWFGFENIDNKKVSLIANHSARSFLNDNSSKFKEFDDAFQENFLLMQDKGLFVTPYCLPIDISDKNLEFGFEFDANSPRLEFFLYRIYNKTGKVSSHGKFSKNYSGPLYSSDLLKLIGVDKKNISNIILSPDWLKHGLNPIGKGQIGQLIVRNKKNFDKDLTEYQSCWRNNQVTISEYPHWLYPSKMLLGGSKLYCGFSGLSETTDVLLSLLNGSGNINYKRISTITVSLINELGEIISFKVKLIPFVCNTFNLEEYKDNWKKHFKKGYGNIIVTSNDADINANLITTSETNVTIQHMWGY